MDDDTKQRIIEAYWSLPEDLRQLPATEQQLRAFEVAFGPIPPDYRWFLQTCGGGVVGSERIDGIDELVVTRQKYRSEYGPPHGWSMQDIFIIGWDGAGNPFGIDEQTGQILVEDHTFGGIHVMALICPPDPIQS